MKRYLIPLAVLVMNVSSMLASDRHGKYYSVRESSDSSTVFLIIGVIIFFLFLWFNSGKKNKK